MTAFYERLEGGPEPRFLPTVATRGPWSPDAQHGGPPAALLGAHMDAQAPAGARALRLTFELLRPVGLAPLRVTTAIARQGQRVAWIEGSLHQAGPSGEVECLRARGVWAKALPESAPHHGADPLPGPEACTSVEPAVMRFPWDEGYHTSMELATGHHDGLALAWFRPRVALAADLPWTPLTRVLVAADSIGGVCATLAYSDWTFVNPELTVHLLRLPEGTWVGLHGTSFADPDGLGLADAALHDTEGLIGRGTQSQVLARRPR